MRQTTINDAFTFSFGDKFDIMTQEELDGVYMTSGISGYGLKDDDRHVMFTVLWSKPNALIGALSGTRFALRGVETMLRKTTTKFKRMDYMQTKICGEKALGFSFVYNVNKLEMAGVAIVFKHKGYFYTVYYYGRRGDGYGTHKVLSQILSTFQLNNGAENAE